MFTRGRRVINQAYGKVRIVPFEPTITDSAPDEATLPKPETPNVWFVHVIPSGDVRKPPPRVPTTSHCVPDQAIPAKVSPTPEYWAVHVIASGEVRMVPAVPLATNCVPDQATALRKLLGLAACGVHVIPSGEVRISLVPPTATNFVPDHVTPTKEL